MKPQRSLSGEARVGFGQRGGADLLGVCDGRLYLRCFGTYHFAADEIVAIERRESAWFNAGVRIVHGRADYPRQMSFRCRDGNDAIFEFLASAGFVPCGSVPAGRSSLLPVARVLAVALAIYAIGVVSVELLR